VAFCPSCGAEVQGQAQGQIQERFCAKCGAPVTAGAVETLPPPSAASAAGLEENVASALCYLLWVVGGILFLVIKPYSQNKTIRFHAFQAIFFWVAAIVVWIAVGIVSNVLSFMGDWFINALRDLIGLAIFIVWLMLMFKAYNRERWVLPVIGPMAEKQA
jgi:uncharacterized membrane protein